MVDEGKHLASARGVQQNARHDLVVLAARRVDQLHEDICVCVYGRGGVWCGV